MNSDLNLQDQTHQLFLQEALAALQQVQQGLENPSGQADWIQPLVQVTHRLKIGAAYLQLSETEMLAQHLRDILGRLSVLAAPLQPDIVQRLLQIQRNFRLHLLSQFSSQSEGISTLYQRIIQDLSELESMLNPADLTAPLALSTGGQDPQQFVVEFTDLLQAFGQCLVQETHDSLTSTLTRLAEAFLTTGTLLRSERIQALAQMLKTSLEDHPRAAHQFGRLVYQQLYSAYQDLAHQRQMPELESPALTMNFLLSFEDAQDLLAWTTESTDTLALSTQAQFIWRSQSYVMVLPYGQIEDHLLALAPEYESASGECFISWNSQSVPLYRLAAWLNIDESAAGTPVHLIVRQGNHLIALTSLADGLMTDETLVIQPAQIPGSPIVGKTALPDGETATVIDLSRYLAQQITSLSDKSVVAETAGDGSSWVLIVDDSRTVRELLSMELQDAGYRICQASHGQEALTQLQNNPAIALVICDLDMPLLDGFEFLRQYQKLSLLKKAPVVILSHGVSDRHRAQLMDLGAQSVLTKTSVDQTFLQQLKSTVSQGLALSKLPKKIGIELPQG